MLQGNHIPVEEEPSVYFLQGMMNVVAGQGLGALLITWWLGLYMWSKIIKLLFWLHGMQPGSVARGGDLQQLCCWHSRILQQLDPLF